MAALLNMLKLYSYSKRKQKHIAWHTRTIRRRLGFFFFSVSDQLGPQVNALRMPLEYHFSLNFTNTELFETINIHEMELLNRMKNIF